LGLVEVGELSPIATASDNDRYQVNRGIEVGHIFKLGDKYSKAMNAVYQDDQKGSQVIQMGCYGIGVTRVIAAAIEQNHDAQGIKWPVSLAPFDVELICLAPEDANVAKAADSIYEALQKRGIDVLYDDRAEMSPGVKFKDADLIGIPHRFVVGKKGLEAGQIEYASRLSGAKEMLPYNASEIVEIILKKIS
jgi:prolyl-tRNA synthetase